MLTSIDPTLIRKRPGRKPNVPGRKRYAPTSTGRWISGEAPRDILTYALLQRHGPLPTPYLYLGTKHLASNVTRHKLRLRDLYHEANTPHGGRMLERPEPQWPYSDVQADVYDNTQCSLKVLEKHGLLHRYAVPAGGPLPHRVMTACLTFSIEYHARAAGLKFISQDEILASPTCPAETRTARNPLSVPVTISHTFSNPHLGHRTSNRPIIPDALFALENAEGKRRYFAVEADRDTENYFRPNLDENSYLRKFLAYHQITTHEVYKRHFGISSFLVLNYTTNRTHMLNLIEALLKLEPRGVPNMLFQAYPTFDRPFTLPKDVLDVFHAPYHRAGCPDFYISK